MRAGEGGPADPRILQLYKDAKALQEVLEVPFHVDHIIPIKHGGKHVFENLQILTATDNLKKGAKLPDQLASRGDDDAAN